ncbi:MAG: hypothetical protein ACOVMQ_08145 [Cyclobacteriaceae bacterium]|jgi:hypothetical protein
MNRLLICTLAIFVAITSTAFLNRTRTVVSVLDTDNSFELRARFPEERINEVRKAIDHAFQPDVLFGKTIRQYDALLMLKDGTLFSLKLSNDRLVIKLNKKKNSEASIERMKRVFDAAKAVIKNDD